MYLEAMLLGRYPTDLLPLLEDVVEPGDMATIRQPLDFYGVNYYNPIKIAAVARGRASCRSRCSTCSATRRPTSAGRSCPTRCASG